MFMDDLISVAAVPSSDKKYITGLSDYYQRIAKNAVDELSGRDESSEKTGRTTMDWEEASQLMLSTLRVKKRLEHG